jgi:formylglycine-generating enzyme required for sulfatase activity
MLIGGGFLIVLLAVVILLWRSQQQGKESVGNFNQSAVAEPSVKEQPASPTPTQTPREPKKPPIDVQLVFVPAGNFMMGSEDNDDELPVHEVTFKKGFYIGKYEITQAQWQAVMGDNPSTFKNCDNCPVENVSWLDVQSFLKKLNESNDSFKYRLPSEAEWEYACRAGTTGSYAGPVAELAWFDENSESKTQPVGSKAPNAFGIYDMHGNVWEWCEDVRRQNYDGAPNDGSAWSSDSVTAQRIARGGSWQDPSTTLTSTNRAWDVPKQREFILGFRVVAVPVATQ